MKPHRWSSLFDANVASYRGARPKRGEYVLRYLDERGHTPASILEMGAFSGKDVRFLSQHLPEALCCSLDRERGVFDREAAQATSCVVADAFAMPFHDGAFELSFHSGLLVVFDDAQSAQIIREQLRVTHGLAFIFVHNRWNFIDAAVSALKRARGNSLFRYRRFSKKILLDMVPSGAEAVRIEYVDNMLINFLRRRLPALARPAAGLARLGDAVLCNEVVMVLKVA